MYEETRTIDPHLPSSMEVSTGVSSDVSTPKLKIHLTWPGFSLVTALPCIILNSLILGSGVTHTECV